MRKFVMVSPAFWIGQTGRDLRNAGIAAQLLALYLLSNPIANYTGLYRLPIIYIANDLGMGLDQVRATLTAVEQTGFAKYDEASEYLWIIEGAHYQLGEELKEKDLKVKYVNKEFATISKSCPFLVDYFAKYGTALRLLPRKDVMCTPGTSLVPATGLVPATAPTPVELAELPYGETTEGILAPVEIADELTKFLAERESRGARAGGAKGVTAWVLNFDAKHGAWLTKELLRAAALAGDYDIVNGVQYEQEALEKANI
ncbi:hypothetical protein ABIB42_004494 [Massilia sp. UYP32]|jgi:hypothetical protein|uniref:hypothetical protein n=1 Tax=Massilia sp. UYP32 TaxID=1756386 RepID=UPI003D220937